MKESGGALGVENQPKPYTFKEISKRFTDYIEKEKPGLERFYKWMKKGQDGKEIPDEGLFDKYLKDPVDRGLGMTKKLMDCDCPREVAMSLSLLALYDVVILIDNSTSMGVEEDGARVDTLSNTLKAASAVYSYAENGGITAVRFLNTPNQYSKVTPGKINALMKRTVFEGVTNIGTKLREKVLVNYVTSKMAKPLLVIVITDAEIEGEDRGLLRKVIVSQAADLKNEYGDRGPEAVAYQFAKIGSDKAAQDLVEGLDNDTILGSYIDCMGGSDRLEDILVDKWRILPKLLLGAISPYWDTETTSPIDTSEGRDGELETQSPDDDLEDDGDDDGILKGGDRPGGDGGGLSNESNPSPPISQPSSPAAVGLPSNGQPNTTSQPENPVQESFPVGDAQPIQNGSGPRPSEFGMNPGPNTSQPSNQAEGGRSPNGQNNNAISPESRADGGPRADSQANSSGPTDDQVKESPRSNGGLAEGGPSPNGQNNTNSSPEGRVNGSPPTDSPPTNPRGPTDDQVKESPRPGGSLAEGGPLTNGQNNTNNASEGSANGGPRADSQANSSGPTDDQVKESPQFDGSQAEGGPSPNGRKNTANSPEGRADSQASSGRSNGEQVRESPRPDSNQAEGGPRTDSRPDSSRQPDGQVNESPSTPDAKKAQGGTFSKLGRKIREFAEGESP